MRERLGRGEIAIHPFVTAELALGSLKERSRTLSLLDFFAADASSADERNAGCN